MKVIILDNGLDGTDHVSHYFRGTAEQAALLKTILARYNAAKEQWKSPPFTVLMTDEADWFGQAPKPITDFYRDVGWLCLECGSGHLGEIDHCWSDCLAARPLFPEVP